MAMHWPAWSESNEDRRDRERYADRDPDENWSAITDPEDEWAAMGEDREFRGTLMGGRGE